ncbi:MAG: hypothetical protein WC668_02270 [Patescibacteria group bacterium]
MHDKPNWNAICLCLALIVSAVILSCYLTGGQYNDEEKAKHILRGYGFISPEIEDQGWQADDRGFACYAFSCRAFNAGGNPAKVDVYSYPPRDIWKIRVQGDTPNRR